MDEKKSQGWWGKALLSGVVIIIFGFYVAFQRGVFNTSQPVMAVTPTPTAPSPEPDPVPSPIPSPVSTGQYKDGSYTGSVADAFYGPLQVKAVISGGKITDVEFLQFPKDAATSRMISSQATPLLKSEAIKVQSANVDIVSGATQTSEAFRITMAAALAQAK